MDPSSWQCRDCDATGITSGEAAAHLADDSLESEHTIDFLDADGEVVSSASTVDVVTQADADAAEAVELEQAPEGPDIGAQVAAITEGARNLVAEALEAERLPLELTDVMHLAYVEQVMAELGPDATVIPCPGCAGRGFRTDPLRVLPGYRRCDDCGGYGRGLTSSSREGETEKECAGCNGTGWRKDAPVVNLPEQPPTPGERPPLPTPPPGYAWANGGDELVRLGG